MMKGVDVPLPPSGSVLGKRHKRTNTFVGTPLYVSPEMLLNNDSGAFTDLWTLGVIIYEMANGITPFYAHNDARVFDNILNHRVTFPDTMQDEVGSPLRDLIEKLLKPDPGERIGMQGYDELKSHRFFRGVDWDALNEQRVEMPVKFAEYNPENAEEVTRFEFYSHCSSVVSSEASSGCGTLAEKLTKEHLVKLHGGLPNVTPDGSGGGITGSTFDSPAYESSGGRGQYNYDHSLIIDNSERVKIRRLSFNQKQGLFYRGEQVVKVGAVRLKSYMFQTSEKWLVLLANSTMLVLSESPLKPAQMGRVDPSALKDSIAKLSQADR